MDTVEEVEAAYARLCDGVRKEALRIFGLAGIGNSEAAAVAASALADMVTTAKNQRVMQRERAGVYDLGALRVDTSIPSDSETPLEND